MKITVASGKGGTGKTTFAVNLAWTLSQEGKAVQLLDGDVEEPNAHLFIHPTFSREQPVEVLKPVWDKEKCSGCGLCAQACQYNALAVVKEKVLIFNDLCHACGVCSQVCPEGALTEQSYAMGKVRVGASRLPHPESSTFFFADGLLNVGEPSAPTVIKELKKRIDPEGISILDAAPGTGCPVVEAIEGSDVVVLVTEPTPFGLHDLKLAAELTMKLGVPAGIVVNRSDRDDDLIADYSEKVGIPIVGRIPFKRIYAEAYSRGDVIAEKHPELRETMVSIFNQLRPLVGSTVLSATQTDEMATTVVDSQKPFEMGSTEGFREIAVISGKGGTGKTTVTTALAQLAEQKIVADNDVDAADLHLLLKPTVHERSDFSGGAKARIDPDLCIACGQCAQACHFGAISMGQSPCMAYVVDELSCEGCTLCQHVCPVDAVSMHEERTGEWFVSRTKYGPMVHARLGIGQENSGKLVTQVRQRAAELAVSLQQGLVISDGPPGTSCPVIASITGVDHVLIVTEPTVSGVHDLVRVLDLCQHFGVPASVVINKADLNCEQAKRIHDLAEESAVRVIGEIPFDRNIHDALMEGKTVLEYGKGPAVEAIKQIADQLLREPAIA